MKRYIMSVDQSAQGTKGLLFDEMGRMAGGGVEGARAWRWICAAVRAA